MAGWISSNDELLQASITKHEGTKNLIYQYIEKGTITVADSCSFEGCKKGALWPAYLDTEGLATVGIGHLITGKESYDCFSGISDEQAYQQLADDLTTHVQAAKGLAESKHMKIEGNEVVQRFMAEMCFNIGAGAYAKFNKGLKKLASAVNNDGEYSYNEAADEHLDSKWARQVKARAVAMVDTLRALDPQETT